MKLSRTIYPTLIAALIGTGMQSCTTDFEEINTNPNSMVVGQLNPYGLFEAMFYGFGKKHIQYCYNYSNELVQFTACSGANNNYHRYSFPNTTLNNIWSAYAQYAANANHMIQLGESNHEDAAIAVGKTLKALFLANATDLFGDIPCTEAFRLAEGITTPKLDSQKDVYLYMFDLLEEANELYAENPKFAKPSIDLMYGGNMASWRKFNNSLYMRLLMRVSGRHEMKSGEKLQEMLDNATQYPIISSNADNATIKNTGVDPYYNYYRPSETTSSTFSNHYVTNHFINMCLLTGIDTEIDPRLRAMARTYASDGDWVGVNGGSVLSDMKEDMDGASYLNYAVLVRDAAPVWIMEYSEVQFILAEAALKGYISGGENASRTYYEKAVRASCEKWAPLVQYSVNKYEIDDTRIADFLNGNLAGWDKHADKARLIGEQKYLSLFWNGFEAYHELRRTGYPIVKIGNGCSYNNYEYPQRLPYPTNTVGSNSVNVQVALDRMGGPNDMRTSVWWSYKAINGTFTALPPTLN